MTSIASEGDNEPLLALPLTLAPFSSKKNRHAHSRRDLKLQETWTRPMASGHTDSSLLFYGVGTHIAFDAPNWGD